MIRLAIIGLCAFGLVNTVPSCSDNSVELHPHEDCTKFYQCSHGQAVEQICPDGLLFNPTTKQCDWPELAGCTEALQARLTADEASDDEVDDNEIAIPAELPAEEASKVKDYYNETTLQAALTADEASEIEDYHNEITLKDELPAEEASKVKDNETTKGAYQEEATTVGRTNIGQDAVKHCAEDNSHGDLLPHRDCNKFYECSFGHAFVLECPYGLLFSTVSNRCEWSGNVDCGDRLVT